VLGAADPDQFRFHERGSGVVGLSSSFYERKNPDCLLQLIKLLPHRQFVLLGRKWNQYARFEEMRAQPNFTYLQLPYRDYPDVYATFDVFLSMSSLEGGPIPLIEAMMGNAVPVASRTGFAPDLIRHGENGFIFDLDAPARRSPT
jgi:glycosyltransferase involved in cell wall biosynthesis